MQANFHDNKSEASPAVAAGEEMVEVELTDLLAHSHKQVLGLQHAFDTRMNEAKCAREAHELKQAREMKELQDAVASSHSVMACMKQELVDATERKLENMQLAMAASQKIVEVAMKEQARYWKSICQELVAEKRSMAQKVAEERGKYTALKAHLASHDAIAATELPCSTREVKHANTTQRQASPSSLTVSSHNERGPEPQGLHERAVASLAGTRAKGDFVCSPTARAARGPLLVGTDGSSRAASVVDASPTHSCSSSRSSNSSFRRYYLSSKGKSSLQ